MPEQKAPAGKVVDLMAALKESVAKAQANRGEDVTIHDMPKKKAAARRRKGRPPRRPP
ncbi:hypothetical protein ACIPC1_17255 [Streptomyces sp. NPDC087263]|uniref:hypothetical protein n=1 Tax=Streptomyces sp. NPDC087263 TaxID=3365773 RepID=UPI00381A5184